MRLERITWLQAKAYFTTNDTVLLAVGSIENHGRHLALGSDTLAPNRILELIEESSDVLIAPTIPYGATEYFADVPGTVDLGNELLYQVLAKVCENLHRHGARHFVILNGHGGNVKAIERVGWDLQRKGAVLACLNWWLMAWDINPAWKGGHGGGQETAGLLGIDRALVDESQIEAPYEPYDLTPAIKANGLSTVEFRGVTINVPRLSVNVSDNGWYGPDHPRTATPEWGVNMLAASATLIADFITEFQKAPLPAVLA
ncbi:MAG: creatininase family protein [Propionibacteriaceae bacterium]|jgi:creatinine amidohydrolase|nr:creatininase family protein [Propionibacteriaceae bacterium]